MDIKFRCYNKKTQKMWDADSLRNMGGFALQSVLVLPYPSDDYVLMQYTGFHDKNDVEIYEKDVCHIEQIGITTVVWDNSSASFMFRHQTETDRLGVYKQYYFSETEMSEIDVIGFITTEKNSYKEGFTPSVGSEFCHEDDVYRANLCVEGLNV